MDYENYRKKIVLKGVLLEDLDFINTPINYIALDAKGMLYVPERKLLFSLSKDYYTGKGAIIDGGSFFGSSCISFAEGLRQNSNFKSFDFTQFPGGKPVSGYEIGFLPAPKSDKIDLRRNFGGTEYILGQSFVPILMDNISSNRDLIGMNIGDLLDCKWDSTPIEICFIDVCKTIKLNRHVSSQFYPNLIDDNSLLVNQDFFFDRLPWIKVTMGYLKDYFLWEGQVHTSSVYRTIKKIPREVADYDPFSEGSVEECLFYHDAFEYPNIDRSTEYLMNLSKAYLIALKDKKEKALNFLKELKEIYKDLLNDENVDRGNAFRFDRAERQIRNGNIFKVS